VTFGDDERAAPHLDGVDSVALENDGHRAGAGLGVTSSTASA
jgi:hypothetical protein